MQDDLSLNTTNSSNESLSAMKTALCEFHEYDTNAALHTISVCRFRAGYIVWIVSLNNNDYFSPIIISLRQFTSICISCVVSHTFSGPTSLTPDL